MSAPAMDVLVGSEIESALAGTRYEGKLQHFAEIGSTNTHAMREGAAGAPDGTVYVADAQTAGRGRGGHQWASPAGSGLYVSVLLRPTMAPGEAVWMTLAAGLAAAQAIAESSGVDVDIRWPNDLLIGARKVGGILTEMQAEATRVRFVVVGVGINVHQPAFPPELAASATSLALATRRTGIRRTALSRTRLLIELLRALDTEVTRLAEAGSEGSPHLLRERMEQRSSWVRGKLVSVGEQDGFSGVTEGLDTGGFLRVRTAAGELRVVRSGSVRAQE